MNEEGADANRTRKGIEGRPKRANERTIANERTLRLKTNQMFSSVAKFTPPQSITNNPKV